jgi:gelsolin
MSGLVKAKEYKIADSNLALFGTPLEKEVKLAAAMSDPEWNAMAKATPTPGLKCWRIEKFTVKKWPDKRIGEFHTGDSYILLHTYKVDQKFLYDVSDLEVPCQNF